MEEKATRLLVLYASQTGNAMDAAERVGREAERGGCLSVHVQSIDKFDPRNLADEHVIIFVISTTGQGDMPDTMKAFWKFLLQRNLSLQWLARLHYAVFGLGDSGYQKYNFAAKKLDKRLSDLGAKPIIEKGLGDDQHPSGYEGALDPWLLNLWSIINQIIFGLVPRVSIINDSRSRNLDPSKFQIIYHMASSVHAFNSTETDLEAFQHLIEKARSMSPVQCHSGDNRPHYMLKMVKNQRLTAVNYDRDTRHFEFETLSPGLDYQLGDVLEILPSQDSAAVNSFIRHCNLDPDCYITVLSKEKEHSNIAKVNGFDKCVKLKDFVSLTMDIASASPRRYFFEIMSFFATAEHERERLQYFSSPEGRDDLYKYNQKERRTVLEVLQDFPSVQMPFEWLVQLVPILKPRAFSISSSPLAHPNQVHLTVSIVSWMTPYKRKRHGLCSNWLAALDPENSRGIVIPAWIYRGTLDPPPPTVPLILIGPGTGCAPFRAFVEERAIRKSSSLSSPILFFFGCRSKANDFLYEEFWLSHSQDGGVLSPEIGGGFLVAFSRDQDYKVYVQHKMKEEGEKIWSLLKSGAAICIAGSSNNMPSDVTACLEEIISVESGISRESAIKWLRMLEKAGRFHIETWS